MYSLYAYGSIIRISACARTLTLKRSPRRVTPGSVVLDIGTGCGIWALFACNSAGAGRSMPSNPETSSRLHREAAQINGFGERIEFIQDLSTRVVFARAGGRHGLGRSWRAPAA